MKKSDARKKTEKNTKKTCFFPEKNMFFFLKKTRNEKSFFFTTLSVSIGYGRYKGLQLVFAEGLVFARLVTGGILPPC